MARGTTFGGLHSHRDLHLIQQQVDVQPAQPKLNLIDVPGANGTKDLSAQPAGRVVFEDRTIEWTFALYPGDNWAAKQREVSNALNGRAARITLDTDPEYYYQGRLSVSKYKKDGLLRQISVSAICRPYKYKQEETVVSASLSTSWKEITLANDRLPVVPSITVTASTTIEWDGGSYTLAAGTHKLLAVELAEGENILRAKVASGSGSITVEYQEGAL